MINLKLIGAYAQQLMPDTIYITYEQALTLVEAGADRIGTSAGVQIVAGSLKS